MDKPYVVNASFTAWRNSAHAITGSMSTMTDTTCDFVAYYKDGSSKTGTCSVAALYKAAKQHGLALEPLITVRSDHYVVSCTSANYRHDAALDVEWQRHQ